MDDEYRKKMNEHLQEACRIEDEISMENYKNIRKKLGEKLQREDFKDDGQKIIKWYIAELSRESHRKHNGIKSRMDAFFNKRTI